MLAPARIPVAAGKNIAKMVKKFCSVPSDLRKPGPKFSLSVSTVGRWVNINKDAHATVLCKKFYV